MLRLIILAAAIIGLATTTQAEDAQSESTLESLRKEHPMLYLMVPNMFKPTEVPSTPALDEFRNKSFFSHCKDDPYGILCPKPEPKYNLDDFRIQTPKLTPEQLQKLPRLSPEIAIRTETDTEKLIRGIDKGLEETRALLPIKIDDGIVMTAVRRDDRRIIGTIEVANSVMADTEALERAFQQSVCNVASEKSLDFVADGISFIYQLVSEDGEFLFGFTIDRCP